MNSSAIHSLPVPKRVALLASVAFMVCPGAGSLAQSTASFATTPFLKAASETLEKAADVRAQPVAPPFTATLPSPPIAQVNTLKPPAPMPIASRDGLPIVMFRATVQPPRPDSYPINYVAPTSREQSPSTAVPDMAAPVAPIELGPPVLMRVSQPPPPPIAARPPVRREYRPAFRRIWQDTKTSVMHDVPEALADALPWVDRNHKDEPFEETLARVADELSRASARDPEWALPAEEELRHLSKVLQTLSEPPPAQSSMVQPVVAQLAEDRPFRPRPIWPGASGRPEPQIRPIAIVTGTELDAGPRTTGVVRPAAPSTEEGDEQAGPRQSTPPPRSRGPRRTRR